MITERHLFLALEAHRVAEEGSRLEEAAIDSILFYAMRELDDEGQDSDDNDLVMARVQRLVNNHALDHYIATGLIEEDFDGVFELTDKGKLEADKIRADSSEIAD